LALFGRRLSERGDGLGMPASENLHRFRKSLLSLDHVVNEPQPTIAQRFVWSIWTAFGGCDSMIPNGLPNMNGWNYTVRLYQARPEVLNSQWKFPEPQPAG